ARHRWWGSWHPRCCRRPAADEPASRNHSRSRRSRRPGVRDPGRRSRGRLYPTSPAVTVQRLQLLALAVALGLLGGQQAAAGPPTLTKPTVSGPPSGTQASSAQLTFASPDAAATFVCRSNGPNWAACTSPV